jgi:branched-subunit amino acid aminotransferase/4-amino-4-deoxychorismate lyase
LKFLLHNDRILPEEAFLVDGGNRLFQYNDGVFETLILDREGIRFLEDHLVRLRKALQVLKMEEPDATKNSEELTAKVRELAALNGLGAHARVKFKVWRAGSGLFTPERMDSHILITVQPHKAHPDSIGQAGFCESLRTRLTPFSFFKGPYSLHYVMAAVERKQRGLAEIILLDESGHVSECGASNIFWIKDGTFYTPSIQTGCIEGVMRANVLRICQSNGFPVETGLFFPDQLLQATMVFTSNVTGLYPILNIGDTSFVIAHPLATAVATDLFPKTNK